MKLGRAFFSWILENGIQKENPFAVCKKKREPDKKRVIIPAEYRARIAKFLNEDPAFLCVCRLVFSSLIRPKEIRLIKVEYIDLKSHTIHIPSYVAKTHKERYATLSPDIETYISNAIHNAPKDFYLFSVDGLRPGPIPVGPARFRKKWMKLRELMDLPDKMQLYSFRDSGIYDLLKSGLDTLSVMQHADHHNLAITTRYADHKDPTLIAKVYDRIKF